MVKEIYLMVGIPGSGKSTYCEKLMKDFEEQGKSVTYISRDAHRKALTGGATGSTYFDKEEEVFLNYAKSINDAIRKGEEKVLIDATHISRSSRNKILKLLNNENEYTLVVVAFDLPLEVVIERNEQRTGFERVPRLAIESMRRRFEAPTAEEFEKYNFKSIHLVNFYE